MPSIYGDNSGTGKSSHNLSFVYFTIRFNTDIALRIQVCSCIMMTLDGFGTKTLCTSSTEILCPRFFFLFTLCSSLAKPLYLKDLVGCSGTRMKLMFLSSPCLFWTIRPKPLKKSCSMREAKVDTKWNVNVKCEYKTRKMKWRYRLQVVIFKFSTSVTEFQAFESQ